ncbi:hypothetical protein BATDEDRAFT_35586 [Batrachochytrium dendrobatidis JAM81]|uniref:N-acetyltransferase domain-containing protein n=2 Tax=Batrachochytrium dendrobatidis TaxID=109871 RepID=F4P6Y4_BATDJ|nr:uncharacterized protein BATDEDRAFT_35586 [Batrachochytrium dendrobatidis JAM81]EGF78926.1 hypothetical protein BATDEDRAFT_35586 [Batrachochytrium dendrobatidis JAM81]KAJ8325138.1 N-acetyltransferase 5 [Batrachochytrium dendrobatidis]KAK5667304.1 N-acetyltransferase 5 [Batrachochytrium dendrobatidis]OAJ42137.1 hypothetical protein BDEG_25636 [Batrachochytrium dendrobatidis JEL423]|eukprot:XP_006680426.1 hypothetical protein BATDEDRAFT_35586 [Batrachochytrium dendrobatidis JAM81]
MTAEDPVHSTDSVETSSTHQKKHFRKALGEITINNLGQIRAIHAAVPSHTPDVLDDTLLNDALALDPISRIVYFNDVCAGAVLCRKVPALSTDTTDKMDVEIVSLLVLPAYTGLGLASMLVKNVVEEATKHPKVGRVFVSIDKTCPIKRGMYSKAGFETDSEPSDVSELLRLVKSV